MCVQHMQWTFPSPFCLLHPTTLVHTSERILHSVYPFPNFLMRVCDDPMISIYTANSHFCLLQLLYEIDTSLPRFTPFMLAHPPSPCLSITLVGSRFAQASQHRAEPVYLGVRLTFGRQTRPEPYTTPYSFDLLPSSGAVFESTVVSESIYTALWPLSGVRAAYTAPS